MEGARLLKSHGYSLLRKHSSLEQYLTAVFFQFGSAIPVAVIKNMSGSGRFPGKRTYSESVGAAIAQQLAIKQRFYNFDFVLEIPQPAQPSDRFLWLSDGPIQMRTAPLPIRWLRRCSVQLKKHNSCPLLRASLRPTALNL